MLKEQLIKWIIGLVIGALTTLGIVFKKHIKDFFSYERKQHQKKLLKEVHQEIADLKKKMIHNDCDLAEYMMTHEELIFEKIDEVKTDIMKVLVPIQEATLSSHFERLVRKCKYYIQKGEITVDELDDLEKDYQTYKSLHGNGHMDMWMNRVRQLPIK